jgi:hypothetical protein
MWKTHEPDHVEDTNYTHADRKFSSDAVQTTIQKAEGDTSSGDLGFPNGAGTPNSYTLKEVNDYEEIVEGSSSYKNFTPESVPRFTKRPGDLVLQGSNNSLIALGEERFGSAQKSDDEKAEKSGAIDVVVGRGRFQPNPDETPEDTAPPTVENTRGYIETDKKDPDINVSEGDPDYIRDSSRLYLSMRSDIDERFELSGNYPKPFKGSIDSAENSASAVLKADEIRIVSRKDEGNEINGSIRIIKEGEEGTDRAMLLFLSDGSAQLDAEVIYLGRAGGAGPGPSGSEPYIKFSKYKSQMTSLISIVREVYQLFLAQYAVPVAAPGTPHPGLTATIPTLTEKIASLTELELSLDEAQSERIFGE